MDASAEKARLETSDQPPAYDYVDPSAPTQPSQPGQPPIYTSLMQPQPPQGTQQPLLQPTVIQPNQANQQPVVVLLMPPPQRQYKATKSFYMSTLIAAILHLVFVTAILIAQIVLNAYPSILSIGQVGIIVGVTGLVVGLLALAAYRKSYSNKGVLVSLMVFSIIMVFFSMALIVIASMDLVVSAIADIYDHNTEERDYRKIFACNIVLIAMAVAEIGISIWTALLPCVNLCNCCHVCCCHKEVAQQLASTAVQPGGAVYRA